MKIKKKLIRVLKRDIQEGIRRHPHLCPVALAAKRARIRNVSVCIGSLDSEHQWNYPSKVQTFIYRFDNDRKVKPISFIATKREL